MEHNLKELLPTEPEDYKSLKEEIRIFSEKNKNKRFTIYFIYYNHLQLAWEYVYKVKPIIQFIIVRNRHPELTEKFVKILGIMNNLNIDRYIKVVTGTNEYGKQLMEYKLGALVDSNEEVLRGLVGFMFSAQPVKERKVSAQVAGFGQSEFDSLMEEEG